MLIDINKIVPGDNDRLRFNNNELMSLSDSIKDQGLLQPITVTVLDPPLPSILSFEVRGKTIKNNSSGEYQIVAGERRFRAHLILNRKTIKTNILDHRSDSSMGMLIENVVRSGLDPIEEAKAYQKRVSEGYTITDICKAIGKQESYIKKRLDLLSLRPDVQKLVSDKQLGVSFAIHLVGLDPNRQLIAIRRLNAAKKSGFSPTTKYFQSHICSVLLAEQSQQGFNFGLFGGGSIDEEASEITPDTPKNPENYKYMPATNDPKKELQRELEAWENARDKWLELGQKKQAQQCQLIINQLSPIVDMMEQYNISFHESDIQKVLRLIKKKGKATKRYLVQYGNFGSKAKNKRLQEILDNLVTSGQISRSPAGRGYNYSIT